MAGAHEIVASEPTVVTASPPIPPVMRLHREILVDIFEICLSMDDDSWDTHSWFEHDTRGRIPFVFSASHVNRC